MEMEEVTVQGRDVVTKEFDENLKDLWLSDLKSLQVTSTKKVGEQGVQKDLDNKVLHSEVRASKKINEIVKSQDNKGREESSNSR